MKKCDKCNFKHFDYEKCMKSFYFKHPYWGEDWELIGAYNHKDAAVKLAEKINQDEPTVNDFVFKNIPIANFDKTDIKYFNVYAEPEIYYNVKQVED
jgi:hypothetical protein